MSHAGACGATGRPKEPPAINLACAQDRSQAFLGFLPAAWLPSRALWPTRHCVMQSGGACSAQRLPRVLRLRINALSGALRLGHTC